MLIPTLFGAATALLAVAANIRWPHAWLIPYLCGAANVGFAVYWRDRN